MNYPGECRRRSDTVVYGCGGDLRLDISSRNDLSARCAGLLRPRGHQWKYGLRACSVTGRGASVDPGLSTTTYADAINSITGLALLPPAGSRWTEATIASGRRLASAPATTCVPTWIPMTCPKHEELRTSSARQPWSPAFSSEPRRRQARGPDRRTTSIRTDKDNFCKTGPRR